MAVITPSAPCRYRAGAGTWSERGLLVFVDHLGMELGVVRPPHHGQAQAHHDHGYQGGEHPRGFRVVPRGQDQRTPTGQTSKSKAGMHRDQSTRCAHPLGSSASPGAAEREDADPSEHGNDPQHEHSWSFTIGEYPISMVTRPGSSEVEEGRRPWHERRT